MTPANDMRRGRGKGREAWAIRKCLSSMNLSMTAVAVKAQSHPSAAMDAMRGELEARIAGLAAENAALKEALAAMREALDAYKELLKITRANMHGAHEQAGLSEVRVADAPIQQRVS